jgi:hypothetical protein
LPKTRKSRGLQLFAPCDGPRELVNGRENTHILHTQTVPKT